ncbi:MAG: hypothetical protein HC799_10890 [Limnothrix sp. RL_2_0]|nr:hypothetical protein [Limnothrix sp. RL_2_0]
MFRTSQSIQNKRVVTRPNRSKEPFNLTGQSPTRDDSFPIDLIRFSIKAEQRKHKQNPTSYQSYLGNIHAAPLISINPRDVTTLDDLFLGEEMQEIFDDVNRMLQQLTPAPCWDEDPFALIAELF